MKEKSCNIPLDSKTEIFVKFGCEKKDISKFAVLLFLYYNKKWMNIDRFDTSHGYVHRDVIGKDGMKKRTEKFSFLSFKSGLNIAIEFYKENYESCVRRFLDEKL